MIETLPDNTFTSRFFGPYLKDIDLAGERETVLDGTTRPFDATAAALEGVGQIAIIGWSSQGPAQAQNLRDTLAATGSDTQVVVGLRPGSRSRPDAEQAGFDIASGTLMTTEEALSDRKTGMAIMLIGDADMARDGHQLTGMMNQDTILGLSHGFWLGHLESKGERPREDLQIVGVCPKGMGPSVRRLYLQGSGINTSIAAEQGNNMSIERALGWAVGIGAPWSFQTTLRKEWRSDVFGERAMLCGGVHGTVEAAYAWKVQNGIHPEKAYAETVESLVGPISRTISRRGLPGVYEQLDAKGREEFEAAYNATYPVLFDLTRKIYADVSSGREISEVVSDNVNNIPMTRVDGGDMWRQGEKVRANRDDLFFENLKIDPTVAGIYIAGMIAQVDVLRANGHHWSEVVNESIIEAVDSLNPYMQARGIDYLVDNCSVTARRGARRWAPLYQAWISQGVLPILDGTRKPENTTDYMVAFQNHKVHGVLQTLSELRPPIDIAVS